MIGNAFQANLDTLNSKNFNDKAPNHGKYSSVPFQYTASIYTAMPKKTLGTTLLTHEK